ncbi:hypothetical protein [Schlesneria paludicola]|uniref:hypothetical protein n=1 Tax=Schlesneria paludicola TaxID=360056 RepID=UPI00029B1388|nr:hypothetical protein [Schlesneria paludicola]
MPGYLIEKAAIISCLHRGTCSTQIVAERVRLSGSPALLKTSNLVISGCSLPSPPTGNGPDISATWIAGATRVKSNGVALLLSDAQGQCKSSGLGVTIKQTQKRVRAT